MVGVRSALHTLTHRSQKLGADDATPTVMTWMTTTATDDDADDEGQRMTTTITTPTSTTLTTTTPTMNDARARTTMTELGPTRATMD